MWKSLERDEQDKCTELQADWCAQSWGFQEAGAGDERTGRPGLTRCEPSKHALPHPLHPSYSPATPPTADIFNCN